MPPLVMTERGSAMSPGGTERLSFTTMIERNGSDLYRFSWSITGNPHDADDVYQETLLKAFKAWKRLPGDANHRAWLFRIASNTWISDRRKQRRLRELGDGANDIPARDPDAASQLDARDTLREVTSAIALLPAKQRTALVLRKYHDMDYAEIGDVLDCTEEAARASVYQALRKLRTEFAAAL
ncbi:hypothetical protein BH23CHL3_BH23CHL3_10000 [soil metagenome]